ncbi:MAG TPA: hydantoinase B/oxoprolinase family protein [Kofleriaceae bacterium]|nr:hydantoinase B/oxoprolinase family protein [Kofleriaceae bacterium]
MTGSWQLWIDRGGTFTDAIGYLGGEGGDVGGDVRTAKVLSGPGSVMAAVRAVLRLADGETPPPIELRLGTTLATNALLERRGARTALVITRGFGDLLVIGDQTRPDLFALDIVRPAPLTERVVEVDACAAPDGTVLAGVDRDEAARAMAALVAAGVTSAAVVVKHGWAAPQLEDELAGIARAAGIAHVTTSADAAAEIGLLARGETAVADAYLTPVLAAYLAELRAELPGSTVRLMQSSGGLADASRLRGRDAALSGPAGGAIATAATARAAGAMRAIGFDMGGTSTDVTCIDGALDREHETMVAGVRVRAPAIAIHTVAAGGGSICRDDGVRLTVGPESAGASPGPLAYGRPDARDLTVTDVDLVLGRLAGDHFPWPLDVAAAQRALTVEAAAGFAEIANANMAEAVRQVTIARGRDVRDFALVVFGGAGGMHACPVAEMLGVTRVIVPRFAGLLSAWGMGLAPLTWHAEVDGGRDALDDTALAAIRARLDVLEREGRAVMAREGGSARVSANRTLALRYRGSDTALEVADDGDAASTGAAVAEIAEAFAGAHRARFGYAREVEIEIAAGRVEVVAASAMPSLPPRATGALPPPRRTQAMWSHGAMHAHVPVFDTDDIPAGAGIDGPALLLDAHASIVIDAGWSATFTAAGTLEIVRKERRSGTGTGTGTGADAVSVAVHANLYMSIASQMGTVLERTAVSTNIRERRDFSCALFDARGGLVANAPHIPVHLGAMGETIRSLLATHPQPPAGTVYATNHPAAGGSHLPDITVITPIHDDTPGGDGRLLYILANRGHHADVGGLTPGSMPPSSRTLADEGIALEHLPIVIAGQLQRDAILAAFAATAHPARRPLDNLADLEAQIAANHAGARLVAAAMTRTSPATFLEHMQHVQAQAAALVARAVAALPAGTRRFADALDDGSPIVATITTTPATPASGARLVIDFTGSSPAHPGNLNAPRAVTMAAVIYVVRALVGAPIPLNAGCLAAVDVIIPPGSILDPPPGAAVVAGNVETSQRIVDVLLGALGLAAASQGTMNNLTLGGADWAYYETIGGGAGATPHAPGASGVHTHMTNTRITDAEILEARFPVRLHQFALRRGSGGDGARRGGDGVIRTLELLAPAEIALVTERRIRAPFGLDGGAPGAPGANHLDGAPLLGAAHVRATAGARLMIETPGGGGHGPARKDSRP